MDTEKRKELRNAYMEKVKVGGVYCIECSGNHKKWVKSTVDMESAKKRFDFSMATKLCPDPGMQREWAEFGAGSFSFIILEELKKGESQTDKEFAADVNALLEIWLEKLEHDPD